MDFWDILVSITIMVVIIALCNNPKLQEAEDKLLQKIHKRWHKK